MGDRYYLARKLQSLFAVSMLRCVLCELVCLSEVCVCVCMCMCMCMCVCSRMGLENEMCIQYML